MRCEPKIVLGLLLKKILKALSLQQLFLFEHITCLALFWHQYEKGLSEVDFYTSTPHLAAFHFVEIGTLAEKECLGQFESFLCSWGNYPIKILH